MLHSVCNSFFMKFLLESGMKANIPPQNLQDHLMTYCTMCFIAVNFTLLRKVWFLKLLISTPWIYFFKM